MRDLRQGSLAFAFWPSLTDPAPQFQNAWHLKDVEGMPRSLRVRRRHGVMPGSPGYSLWKPEDSETPQT